ncbi:hypothetical protein CRE_12417 [Caenorhabditis remanei]|uniref:Potassium channel tetramerisation-type BTB domain-containing protein n=1 Tax=Caenorhabditis remanei TaxID=31234 RepID=E3NQ44_CAERE|nr:hypothetical protein CRE_12417 [Caenorhabditis remanei]
MRIEAHHDPRSDCLRIQIGDKIFNTKREYVMRKEGKLKTIIETNSDTGRDDMSLVIPEGKPNYFQLILNYHRNGFVDLPQFVDLPHYKWKCRNSNLQSFDFTMVAHFIGFLPKTSIQSFRFAI